MSSPVPADSIAAQSARDLARGSVANNSRVPTSSSAAASTSAVPTLSTAAATSATGDAALEKGPAWGSRSVDEFQKLLQVGEGTYG